MALGLGTFLEILSALILLLGSVSAFLWLIAKFASQHIFNRLLESHRNELNQTLEAHKMKLKKSEFLFQREFEATSELISVIRDILPHQNFPDMDWHEACNQMAHDFGNTEVKLDRFIAKHGAALHDEAVDKLVKCIGLAATKKFDINNGHVHPHANKGANDLYENLKDAEEIMLSKVRSQSTT